MKKTILLICLIVLSTGANSQIVINEINYKDALDFPTKDWIELYNNSGVTVDISNWVFKDNDDLHEFIIPSGTTMAPGSYLVLTQFLADFQALFPGASPVIGDFEFGLSGGGELIRLYNATDQLVDFVEYSDLDPWPTEPDGNGPTLELRAPDLDNNLASSWAASIAPDGTHGTPCQINSVSLLGLDNFNKVSFSISPNPLTTSTTIKISNSNNSHQLRIYDVLGKLIKTLKITSNEFILQKENLETGIYMLNIYSEDGSFQDSKKLIVN
tara:strand:- start:3330 stop:4139 length:810 start_codon:yes stop_codon:yes gene_type:complete